MLKKVQLKNFRSLRDFEVDLEPLTILVGPNASGKSAVLDALNPRPTPSNTDVWQNETDRQIVRRYVGEDGDAYTYPNSEGKSTKEGFEFSADPYQKLQLELNQLRSSNKASSAKRLDIDGGNLTNMFSTLTRDEQTAVRDEFCELIPAYSDINVQPVSSGNLELRFQDRRDSDTAYTPEQLSDGSILLLGYLVLQYQRDFPDVLAVEHPERNLHPELLENLVVYFRELANGDRRPEAFNIVLATHSAELLDCVEPEEVRFLEKDSEMGETLANKAPVDDPEWTQTMEAHLNSLRSVWLSGQLGGLPSD